MEDNTAVAEENVASAAQVGEEVIPPKKKKRHVNQQKLQDNLWGWAFCIPLIVGTVWFIYSALIMALLLSFTDYTLGSSGSLVEFLGHMGEHINGDYPKNELGQIIGTEKVSQPFLWYSQVFTTKIKGDFPMSEAGRYLFNTVFYMIGIPIGMILSMFFAVCMSRDIKGGSVFRVLYYIPCVASTVSIIYTFKLMFSPSGVINNILGINIDWLSGGKSWNTLLHKSSTSRFMNDPFWCQGFLAKCVIVIMSVWKGLGGTIILYVAGLSGVNSATKEAAQIDGANGWKIFWKVMMPDLYPTMFYNIVTAIIGGLQIYAEPVLLMEGENSLTSGYVSLIWQYGLTTNNEAGVAQPSKGAAYGMVLAVIIFALTLFQFWLDSRKKD